MGNEEVQCTLRELRKVGEHAINKLVRIIAPTSVSNSITNYSYCSATLTWKNHLIMIVCCKYVRYFNILIAKYRDKFNNIIKAVKV